MTGMTPSRPLSGSGVPSGPSRLDPPSRPSVASVPPLADLLEQAHVVRVPLRVRFRGVTRREGMLLRGPAGWGEFAPFVEYEDAQAARWLAAAIEAAWVGPPASVREVVPVNATVPAVPAVAVADVLARFDGCRTAKVKVAESGQAMGDDLDRVAAVRDQMGDAARIRVDANGAWSVDQARDALARLAAYDLEYAEQPCASVEELAALRIALARAGVNVPIAADESIRQAEDPLLVRDLDAADVIVIKVAPLGGARAALRIVQDCGLPAVVSSALDTSVGLASGLAVAAALPALPYDCGLGTAALLWGDVVAQPLLPVGGLLPVREVSPDPALVEAFAPPPSRVLWWQERLSRCHALL
ncbi:MAG: o-succinylbenzoate synthase [Dermatophilaceae bacterium]